ARGSKGLELYKELDSIKNEVKPPLSSIPTIVIGSQTDTNAVGHFLQAICNSYPVIIIHYCLRSVMQQQVNFVGGESSTLRCDAQKCPQSWHFLFRQRTRKKIPCRTTVSALQRNRTYFSH